MRLKGTMRLKKLTFSRFISQYYISRTAKTKLYEKIFSFIWIISFFHLWEYEYQCNNQKIEYCLFLSDKHIYTLSKDFSLTEKVYIFLTLTANNSSVLFTSATYSCTWIFKRSLSAKASCNSLFTVWNIYIYIFNIVKISTYHINHYVILRKHFQEILK